MQEIIIVIKEVGFPIFVALFVLVRLERGLKGIESKLGDMTGELKKFNGK